jgi:TonB family protein
VDGLLSTLVADDWSIETNGALARVRQRVEAPSRGSAVRRWWTVSAAACVLLVVLFGFWHRMRFGHDGRQAVSTTAVAINDTRGPLAGTSQGQAPDRVPGPANGLKNPVMLRPTEPEYTQEALKAHLEGDVELEAVVLQDGTVANVRVTRSLDKTRGLDDEAVRSARRWTFQPGRDAHGRATAITVSLVVEFRIHGQTAAPAGPRPFQDAFAQGAYNPGEAGVVGPQLVNRTEARYTADAMRAKIQGDVLVEAIVMPDGTVGDVRVVESIDPYGLDDEAIKAVKQGLYVPATLNGQPVSVLMTVTVPFRLH